MARTTEEIYLETHPRANSLDHPRGDPRCSDGPPRSRSGWLLPLLLAAALALLFGCGGRSPGATVSRGAGASSDTVASPGTAGGAPPGAATSSGATGGSGRSAAAGSSGAAGSPDAKAVAAAGSVSQGSSLQGAGSESAAMRSPSAAYLAFVTGTVTLSGSGANGPAQIAEAIAPGTSLDAGPSSAAEIRIGSDAMDIGIGESTRLTLSRLDLPRADAQRANRLIASVDLSSGVMLGKVGASLVKAFTTGESAGTSRSTGGASESGTSVILEISTPELFLTTTGGSFLARDDLAAFTGAVGVGRVWIIPKSLVYTDLVVSLRDAKVTQLLDSLLGRSFPLDAGQEITIAYAQLHQIDEIGAAIRGILAANLAEPSFPAGALTDLTKLVEKAEAELPAAIGAPANLDPQLRAELVPSPAPLLHTIPETATPGAQAAASASPGSRNATTAGVGAAAQASSAVGGAAAGAVSAPTAASQGGSGTASSSGYGSAVAKELMKEAERLFATGSQNSGTQPAQPATSASTSGSGAAAPGGGTAAGSGGAAGIGGRGSESAAAGSGPIPPVPPKPPTPPTLP